MLDLCLFVYSWRFFVGFCWFTLTVFLLLKLKIFLFLATYLCFFLSFIQLGFVCVCLCVFWALLGGSCCVSVVFSAFLGLLKFVFGFLQLLQFLTAGNAPPTAPTAAGTLRGVLLTLHCFSAPDFTSSTPSPTLENLTSKCQLSSNLWIYLKCKMFTAIVME